MSLKDVAEVLYSFRIQQKCEPFPSFCMFSTGMAHVLDQVAICTYKESGRVTEVTRLGSRMTCKLTKAMWHAWK